MHSTLTDVVRELLLLDKHQILKGNEDWGSGLVLDIDPQKYRYLVYMLLRAGRSEMRNFNEIS